MEILKAVTDLIKALVWPALVLFLAFWYQADFLSILKTREFKVSATGGIEIGKLVESIQTTRERVDQALQRLAEAPPQDQQKISADFRRNLNQDLTQLQQQLSAVPPSQPAPAAGVPTEKPPGVPQPGTSATDRERQGFRELAARNFDAALASFDASFTLFPALHNVSEIRDLLRQHATELKTGEDRAWKELYGEILKKYSWGMPADVRIEFQSAVKKT
jgi:hypothetical protein